MTALFGGDTVEEAMLAQELAAAGLPWEAGMLDDNGIRLIRDNRGLRKGRADDTSIFEDGSGPTIANLPPWEPEGRYPRLSDWPTVARLIEAVIARGGAEGTLLTCRNLDGRLVWMFTTRGNGGWTSTSPGRAVGTVLLDMLGGTR